MAGVSYILVERSSNPKATANGILTVCDNLPADWSSADVSVPITLPAGGKTVWVSVSIQKTGQKKTVTVIGNPLGALRILPWLAGSTLQSAQPQGYKEGTDAPRGHISWEFVGTEAAHQTVTVTTKANVIVV